MKVENIKSIDNPPMGYPSNEYLRSRIDGMDNRSGFLEQIKIVIHGSGKHQRTVGFVPDFPIPDISQAAGLKAVALNDLSNKTFPERDVRRTDFIRCENTAAIEIGFSPNGRVSDDSQGLQSALL